MTRISWSPVIEHAAEIVGSYDTGVTLRQLFYRLVADGTLPNTRYHYQRLSAKTAEARRNGDFPDLLDRTSRIEWYKSFTGPADAVEWVRDRYRRDRTEGQEWTIMLGVEKAGLSAQLAAWSTDPLGIPHVALGGFASQTLCDQVRGFVEEQKRQAVLIYAGDHDPSGEDIDRDFTERVGAFDKVIRVALNADQLAEFDIPSNQLDESVEAKLSNDSRARVFRKQHGYLDQYEVDALDPDLLRDLYQRAIGEFWDETAYEAIKRQEQAERDWLGRLSVTGGRP